MERTYNAEMIPNEHPLPANSVGFSAGLELAGSGGTAVGGNVPTNGLQIL